MKPVICFDLDNVICHTKGNNYNKSKPKKDIIKIINKLFDAGYEIKIFTARYMGRNNDNFTKAKKQASKITLNQLKKWNLKYSKLIFGKPSFDIYIDDKAIFFKKNWPKELKKIIKFRNLN